MRGWKQEYLLAYFVAGGADPDLFNFGDHYSASSGLFIPCPRTCCGGLSCLYDYSLEQPTFLRCLYFTFHSSEFALYALPNFYPAVGTRRTWPNSFSMDFFYLDAKSMLSNTIGLTPGVTYYTPNYTVRRPVGNDSSADTGEELKHGW